MVKSTSAPRVLLVQRILPPYRLRFFQQLAQSANVCLTLAYGEATQGSALRSIRNPAGLSIVTLTNRTIAIDGRDIAVFQHGLLRLVASRRFDAVIAEFNPRIASNMAVWVYSRLFRIPLIWWGHGMSPRSSRLAVLLRLLLARGADAMIFYEESQASVFVNYGIPRAKVFVAPNSVDVETIQDLSTGKSRDQRSYILYVGRLIAAKKVDLLVQAWTLAHQQLPSSTRLVIIGEGPERGPLAQLVTDLGMQQRVYFAGAIYEEDEMATWFDNAWVSVSPGYVGLSAIHSLAYGVPMIVAQDEPHSPEIAVLEDGKTARFFASDDADDLARALVQLSADAESWDMMSANCIRITRRRYGVSAMVRAFESAVLHCLD